MMGLLNLAVLLYYQTWGGVFGVLFGGEASALWWLFLLNTSALVLWELGARRWLSVDGARRLLALGSGIPITLLMMMVILDESEASSLALLVYALWLVALYGVYRYWKPDLFMLAGGCLSAIVITILFLARHLFWQAEAAGFLFLSLAVLGLGAAVVLWLKRLHAEMHS